MCMYLLHTIDIGLYIITLNSYNVKMVLDGSFQPKSLKYEKHTEKIQNTLFSYYFHIFFIFWAQGPMGPGPGAAPPGPRVTPGPPGPRGGRGPWARAHGPMGPKYEKNMK